MNFEGSETTHIVGGQFFSLNRRERDSSWEVSDCEQMSSRGEKRKKKKKRRKSGTGPGALPDIPYLKALVFTLALVIASSVTLTRPVTFLLAHPEKTNTALGSLAR